MLTSDYGSFQLGPFYIGWNNHPFPPVNDTDYGDETFGVSIGRFYVGHYNGSGWCAGVLDENGCLND